MFKSITKSVITFLIFKPGHASRHKVKESPFIVKTNYTRRNNYPDYCSSPNAMEERIIPTMKYDGFEIDQVFVTIRHGARTPWEGKLISF